MPRFITVNLQCDWAECDVIGPEDSGEVIERTITLDRSKPKRVLVCKQHNEDLDNMLIPLMQKGTTVDNGTSGGKKGGPSASPAGSKSSRSPVADLTDEEKAERLVCREDNCDRHGEPLKNRTGIAQHVTRTHGYDSLDAYEKAHGLVA